MHNRLKKHAERAIAKVKTTKLDLDAYVISVTSYDELHPNFANADSTYWTIDQFADEHVLFQDDEDYISRIF